MRAHRGGLGGGVRGPAVDLGGDPVAVHHTRYVGDDGALGEGQPRQFFPQPDEGGLGDGARDAVPVHLGDAPPGFPGQLRRPHGDAVGLDVVGVAVAAVVVVGDEDLGAYLEDDLDEERGGLVDVGLPEAGGVVVVRQAHHPGVAVAAGAAEQTEVLDAECGHGGGEFTPPVLPQRGAGQVPQLWRDDLAALTEGAGDQGHVGTLGRVPGHGRAVVDRLVVRVRVHQQQTPSGARWGSPGRRLGEGSSVMVPAYEARSSLMTSAEDLAVTARISQVRNRSGETQHRIR